jgi:hypothetical protein
MDILGLEETAITTPPQSYRRHDEEEDFNEIGPDMPCVIAYILAASSLDEADSDIGGPTTERILHIISVST